MVPLHATHLKYKNIFTLQLTCNFHLQKENLFQEITQYLEFFMVLHVFKVTMMTPSSKFKQYFEGVDLNPSYAPATGDSFMIESIQVL